MNKQRRGKGGVIVCEERERERERDSTHSKTATKSFKNVRKNGKKRLIQPLR